MSKVDMHCHSFHSEHPSDWFLQRLGAKESYTDPYLVYKMARDAGMDFVTITDHNRIDGVMMLQEKYGDQIITGVEATAYFPEDMCKIHVLIYGFNEKQYNEFNHIRRDIYELRDYLKQHNLAHSVAHASFSINGKLKREHLEKLLLLFDVFEGINGGRAKANNNDWMNLALQLNPDIMDTLYSRHRIEPYSEKPWIKGFTGGSDDHGGLFVGKTWTEAEASTSAAFLDQIRSAATRPAGRHNTYHAFTFTVYKIAWDFSRQRAGKASDSLLGKIAEQLVANKGMNVYDQLRLHTMKGISDLKGDQLQSDLLDLVKVLNSISQSNMDDKVDLVYDRIAKMADSYLRIFLDSLEDDLQELDLFKIIRNVSGSLPGLFMLLPFFSALKHMHRNRNVLTEMKADFQTREPSRKKRTLWFSDTLTDLNGVSYTLNRMGKIATENGWDVQLVSSLTSDQLREDLPENFINLPYMKLFQLPFYECYKLKVPSILNSIRQIHNLDPDQIIISTPGPMGMIALLAARMMQIKCIGIYHTDFIMQAAPIINDESAINTMAVIEKWFYSQMDEIRVPSTGYMQILKDRGISAPSMNLLKRGIETEVFHPYADRKKYLKLSNHELPAVTLLYAGRISHDKSLDLLIQAFLTLQAKYDNLQLILAGDGPILPELRESLASNGSIKFTGSIPREQLADLYNAADFFVFPSITDTFGMVILEAQACGLPAIVSAQGGPRDIIAPGETGYIVPDQTLNTWVDVLEACLQTLMQDPQAYSAMRDKSRELVLSRANWITVLNDLLGDVMIA